MIQNILRNIGGIGLYGVMSVCLFFLVFTTVVVRACTARRALMDRLGRLPLAEEGNQPEERPHE